MLLVLTKTWYLVNIQSYLEMYFMADFICLWLCISNDVSQFSPYKQMKITLKETHLFNLIKICISPNAYLKILIYGVLGNWNKIYYVYFNPLTKSVISVN